MPPYGESRSLHRVWNTKCENPLTGTEPGTSLKVYSVLLARGCCASSSHTEWEEERRFTKDRKDCGDREEDFISQLHPSLFLHLQSLNCIFGLNYLKKNNYSIKKKNPQNILQTADLEVIHKLTLFYLLFHTAYANR